MAAARKSSRYGHRGATMILIGYRHGLRHGCGYALANAGHDTRALQACSATRTSSAPCATPSCHRIGSRTSGADGHMPLSAPKKASTHRNDPILTSIGSPSVHSMQGEAKMQFPIHPHMLRHETRPRPSPRTPLWQGRAAAIDRRPRRRPFGRWRLSPSKSCLTASQLRQAHIIALTGHPVRPSTAIYGQVPGPSCHSVGRVTACSSTGKPELKKIRLRTEAER